MGTNVQRFAPGFGMGADDRMVNQLRRVLAFDMMAMDSAQPPEPRFEVGVESLIGGVAVAPPRGTAGGRKFDRVDDGKRSGLP